MRVAAEEAIRFRDRREPVPADLTRGCADLAAAAEHLATPAPPWLGFRALVAAEQARAGGAVGTQAWLAAVGAWQDTGEPHLLAYALLRLAEAYSQAGDRQEAARAVQRAHAIADRLGAAPIAEEAAALARRARLSLHRPRTPRPARDGARRAATAAGRTRQVRAHRARARGADPARGRPVQPRDRASPVHQRQDRQRARVEHPGQAGRQRPGRSRGGSAPARRLRSLPRARTAKQPSRRSKAYRKPG